MLPNQWIACFTEGKIHLHDLARIPRKTIEEASWAGAYREAELNFSGYFGEQLEPLTVNNSTLFVYRSIYHIHYIDILTIPHSDPTSASTRMVFGTVGFNLADYIIFGHDHIAIFQRNRTLWVMHYSKANSNYIASHKNFVADRAVRYQVDWASGRILVPSMSGWRCERLTV